MLQAHPFHLHRTSQECGNVRFFARSYGPPVVGMETYGGGGISYIRKLLEFSLKGK